MLMPGWLESVRNSKRALAIIGLIVGLVLVGAVIGVTFMRSSGNSTSGYAQRGGEDPCRAGLSPEMLYRTALAAQSSGTINWSRAIACTQAISETNPDYKQTLFIEAWALWNTGQRSAAISEYKTYLKLHPEDVQGWLNLGYSLIVIDKCKAAVPALNTVLKLQPSNTAAVHNLVLCGDLGDAYAAALHAQSSGNFADELVLAQQIARSHPNFANILFLVAWAQWNVGQREQAVATYRRYLKSHPRDVQATLNLGVALIELGRCSEAIPPLRHVRKLQPANAAARRDLAICEGTYHPISTPPDASTKTASASP